MHISVIGTGYVGLVTGVCLAEMGNFVCCLDIDRERVRILNEGGVPIHEPGLKEMIRRNVSAKRLTFTCDVEAAVAHGEVQFIAVGTPSTETGAADLAYVLSAAENIGRYANEAKVVVNKSTVPIGTVEKVRSAIEAQLRERQVTIDLSVVSNPEFLKEGAAIEDFMRPDRIVLGIEDGDAGQRGLAVMRQLYAPFNRNHERTVVTDCRSSEFIKYAANAMLATRISFMNDLANLADSVGADIEAVRRGIGSDPRIGFSFLYAGAGYGGSCFPKDVRALIHTAQGFGHQLRVLEAVQDVNRDQVNVLFKKIKTLYGSELAGRVFAVWGLAFKPNTDDMREAPSRPLIASLLRAGARVVAHDPVATVEARRAVVSDLIDAPELLSGVEFASTPYEAVEGADALVVMTEWSAYKAPDLDALRRMMKSAVVFDGRNIYDPELLRCHGIRYEGIGRGMFKQQQVDVDAV